MSSGRCRRRTLRAMSGSGTGMQDLKRFAYSRERRNIAQAEAKIAEMGAGSGHKRLRMYEVARSRLEKLKRGETVPGGLGKRLDLRAVIAAAGLV